MNAAASRQFDLFTVAPEAIFAADDLSVAWEARALRDLSSASLTYCFPGFMGSVCEGLVDRGLAAKESAGFLDLGVPAPRGWKASEHPQFRYRLTDAGRSSLPTEAT